MAFLVSWLMLILACSVTAIQSKLAADDEEILPPTRLITADIDNLVTELLSSYHVPGISVAVVDIQAPSGQQIESKAYGFSNLPSTPASTDTLYFAGSTTKAFTAAAVGKLFQQNQSRLNWRSRIHDTLLDDFKLNDDHATRHTTIEDALSHRSGLPRHDLAYRSVNASAMTRLMRFLPMTRESRTTFQYCNLMYAAISHLIERLSGQTLGSVLEEWFWDPLGMQSTMFFSPESLSRIQQSHQHRLSRGYHWVQGKDTGSGYYLPEPYIDLSGLSGASAIISSVEDYALWLKSLLQTGSEDPINVTSPINRFLYQSIMTPRTIMPQDLLAVLTYNNNFATPPNYALGWITSSFRGHVVLSHPGSLTGFGTEIYILPDDGVAVVTMANTAGTSNTIGALIALRILKDRLMMDECDSCENKRNMTNWDSLTGFRLSAINTETSPSEIPLSVRIQALNVEQHDHHHSESEPEDIQNLSDLLGMYSHNAYGRLNITAAVATNDSCLSSTYGRPLVQQPSSQNSHQISSGLCVTPSVRVWPFVLQLSRLKIETCNGSFYRAEIWRPHGVYAADAFVGTLPACGQHQDFRGTAHADTGSLVCSETVSWTVMSTEALAYFEFGPGGVPTQFGVELESEMVQATLEQSQLTGKFDWRSAMIWFARE